MTAALVADDEEAPREALVSALRTAWPALRVVATAANGVDAWDAFLEHGPDVCFLDIRMPGLSGLDVARRIGARAHVVFATAHGDHALEAFDTGAIDYLLKPIDGERLAQTVARLRSRMPLAGAADVAETDTCGVPSAAKARAVMSVAGVEATEVAEAAAARRAADVQAVLDRLVLPQRRTPLAVLQAGVGREVRMIRCDEVVYFESDSRYTRVVHDGGEALIRTPLKELLTQIDEAVFWQVHRSVIVDHRRVASAVRIDEGNMHLTLRGRPETLPVSRHFQGLFRAQ